MTQPDLAGTRAEDGARHRECAKHRLMLPLTIDDAMRDDDDVMMMRDLRLTHVIS